MNWRHFTAFVWLRWRLLRNHWRRAGALNSLLMLVVTLVALWLVVPLFLGAFVLGLYAIPKATPAQLMYAWDALICAFLLFWGVGLITDLQRNDPLSLSKFLHLPVSVQGAFLINYISSLARLSLLVFGPLMLAFALALVFVKGAVMWPVLPSLAAFLLMVTGPTYQFQGWLASLMSNPRRRRTVVVATTAVFVLIFQLPNLLSVYYAPRLTQQRSARLMIQLEESNKLQHALQAGQMAPEEVVRRLKELQERNVAEDQRATLEDSARMARTARLANTVLPPGWLPLGVRFAAEGRVAPSLLGLAGMTLIGAASLWRAYRTTLALYQGQATNRQGRLPAPRVEDRRGTGGRLLELRLPGLSEPVSAIALAGFRSLSRSPEAKMALLSPLFMGGIFGSMLFRGHHDVPESLRTLYGIGAIVLVLFGLLQLMSNMFGTDGSGFRVFVLCAAPRRDILLGKNLVHAPLAVVLSVVLLTALQFVYPMRLDHVLSMVPQFVSMYLLICLVANLISIHAPVFTAGGTLKPANPKLSTILLQMAMVLLLFPLSQGVTLLPLAIEAGLRAHGWGRDVPVCLLLALAECVAICVLYRFALNRLGERLQAREQWILETVTNRSL